MRNGGDALAADFARQAIDRSVDEDYDAGLPDVFNQVGRQNVAVPYCQRHELSLFFLESLDDLEPRTLGILEPKDALRTFPDRTADVHDLDLIVVPGVAFDRRGARLGYGKGYYDRLLRRVRPDTPFVALSFECQIFPQIPTAEYDVLVDRVVTEQAIYLGQQAAAQSSECLQDTPWADS